MPLFRYRARNARGESVEGRLEAARAAEAADRLLAMGYIPLAIEPLAQTAAVDLAALLRARARAIDLTQLQLFTRQLHSMLKAGVPILQALSGLRAAAINPGLGQVLADVQDSLGQGRELSVSLARHPRVFDGLYLAMVRVGEMTGRLDEVLDRLARHLEFVRRTRERVKSALRYPFFVLLALVAAMAAINLFVIPAFSKVYAGMQAELPWLTRMLLAFSAFTREYLHAMLTGTGAALLAFLLWIRTRRGRHLWDRTKLRLPIVGKILHKTALGHFARSFALGLRSGVPVLQALSVVAAVADNRYLAERIEQMRTGVEHGESLLATATQTGVFTPVVLQMIAVGEQTGELDRLLDEIGAMYEQEVDYEIATLAQQIEPLLIVALGAMVLVLALGIFLPIWEMSGKMMAG